MLGCEVRSGGWGRRGGGVLGCEVRSGRWGRRCASM